MNSTPTIKADTTEPVRAGTLGIGYPPPARTGLGAYAHLVCEDCRMREIVAKVEYLNEPMLVCSACLPELVANGAYEVES